MKNSRKCAIVAVFLTIFLLPNFASAQTMEELQNKIADLLKQLSQLQAQIAQMQGATVQWCHDFNTDLKIGMGGSEVEAMQVALDKEGFSINSEEKNSKKFDESTASAVSGLQQKYENEILAPLGLKYPTGYFGKATRAKLTSLYGCAVKQTPSTTVQTPIPTAPTLVCAQVITPAKNPLTGECVSFATPCEVKAGWEKVSSCALNTKPPTTSPSTVGTGTHKFRPIDPSRCPGVTETSCTLEPANIIKVSVYDEKGVHVDTRENTNSGMAGFLNLPYGNYTVVINAEGFEYYKAPFTVCATCGEITTIYLKKISTLLSLPSSSITVLSPKGGELWEVGKTYTIQWESKDIPSGSDLKIELMGSKGIETIMSSISNGATSAVWAIPTSFPVGTYVLKVTSYAFSCGGRTSSCGGEGMPFSVVTSTTAKTCTELQSSQKYYFDLCSDAGWDNICLNKFTGIYQGCTKNTNNDCTVSNANAEQNLLCAITPTTHSINVLSPNGGENWQIGNTYAIKWATSGYSSSGVVRIILVDGNSGKETPLYNEYNVGSHSWMIPSTLQPHSNYKIKIVAPDEKYDESDAPFSIAAATTGQVSSFNQLANILESARGILNQLLEISKGR